MDVFGTHCTLFTVVIRRFACTSGPLMRWKIIFYQAIDELNSSRQSVVFSTFVSSSDWRCLSRRISSFFWSSTTCRLFTSSAICWRTSLSFFQLAAYICSRAISSSHRALSCSTVSYTQGCWCCYVHHIVARKRLCVGRVCLSVYPLLCKRDISDGFYRTLCNCSLAGGERNWLNVRWNCQGEG